MKILKHNWFLLLLFGVVIFGYTRPEVGGWIGARLPLEVPIGLVLFLLSLTLPGSAFAAAFARTGGLALALISSYVLLPLLVAAASLLPLPLSNEFRVGLAIMAAVPTTLASGAILTRLAGGNDALALAVTMLSNLGNCIAAPLILFLLLGAQFELPASRMLEMGAKLFLVVVIPVGAGQLARRWISEQALAHKRAIDVVCQLMILTVVLIAVSRAAMEGAAGGLSAPMVVGLLILVAAVHVLTAGLCWLGGGWLGLSRGDRIAVMFSGAQKTLPLGLYVAAEFFPLVKFAALPILFYHASQLVLDSLLAERLKREPEGDRAG